MDRTMLTKLRFIVSNSRSADNSTKLNILQTILNHEKRDAIKAASNKQGTYVNLSKLPIIVIDTIYYLIEKRTNIINSKYIE